jgi:hypothetical protein
MRIFSFQKRSCPGETLFNQNPLEPPPNRPKSPPNPILPLGFNFRLPWLRAHVVLLNDPGRLLSAHLIHTWAGFRLVRSYAPVLDFTLGYLRPYPKPPLAARHHRPALCNSPRFGQIPVQLGIFPRKPNHLGSGVHLNFASFLGRIFHLGLVLAPGLLGSGPIFGGF